MSAPDAAQARSLRAVVFDLDGTLVDDLSLTFAACRCARRPLLGRAITDAEIAAHFGPAQEGIAAALAPGHGGACLARFLDFFATHFDEYVRPLAGIEVLLADVRRRGLHSAVVTGAGESSVHTTLAKLRLQASVERVLTGQPPPVVSHSLPMPLIRTGWYSRL